MKRKLVIVVFCLLAAVLVFGLAGCGGDGSDTSGEDDNTVTLYCAECEENGTDIILWMNPQEVGKAGTVPNNTTAEVSREQIYNGKNYYYVIAGGVEGWVSEDLIKD